MTRSELNQLRHAEGQRNAAVACAAVCDQRVQDILNAAGIGQKGRLMAASISEQSEAFRQWLVRQLEQEQRALDQRSAQADQAARQITAAELQLQQKKLRLHQQPPAPDVCPRCFYLHGSISRLLPVPGGTQEDNFACPTCGHDITVAPERDR